ncbi:hypothetical protein BGZ65_004088 [Modicella reniformis]|uniref:Multiple myeloma tumor-associated protein 2-like N-terminal domain-containing protein n=1 Tax=Modicella reniformis TaxID=1440133 RepID=A0A9P6IYV0_9FUNG|nr:hypothetical protein BGZ65_004088 [Modicella reniformis]
MFHPTRGGTRGGRDQFKWDDVKDDKYRENYLGNSLHAAVGRWQKGRDITWYVKEGGDDKDLAALQANKKAEIQSIKDAEAEAMAEALGYKSKRKIETNVTEKELKSAISKTDSAVQEELDEKIKESSAIEGLGFRSRSQRMYSGSGSGGDSSSLGLTSRAGVIAAEAEAEAEAEAGAEITTKIEIKMTLEDEKEIENIMDYHASTIPMKVEVVKEAGTEMATGNEAPDTHDTIKPIARVKLRAKKATNDVAVEVTAAVATAERIIRPTAHD